MSWQYYIFYNQIFFVRNYLKRDVILNYSFFFLILCWRLKDKLKLKGLFCINYIALSTTKNIFNIFKTKRNAFCDAGHFCSISWFYKKILCDFLHCWNWINLIVRVTTNNNDTSFNMYTICRNFYFYCLKK